MRKDMMVQIAGKFRPSRDARFDVGDLVMDKYTEEFYVIFSKSFSGQRDKCFVGKSAEGWEISLFEEDPFWVYEVYPISFEDCYYVYAEFGDRVDARYFIQEDDLLSVRKPRRSRSIFTKLLSTLGMAGLRKRFVKEH